MAQMVVWTRKDKFLAHGPILEDKMHTETYVQRCQSCAKLVVICGLGEFSLRRGRVTQGVCIPTSATPENTMWGASMSMSLGAKKNAEKASSPLSAKYMKDKMSVPKKFTMVANQITNFMKENFLKDETTTQTPSIQKRTMQADTCCLNNYMISAIIDQVSPFYIVYAQ